MWISWTSPLGKLGDLLDEAFVATAAKRWKTLTFASTVWRRWLPNMKRGAVRLGSHSGMKAQRTEETYLNHEHLGSTQSSSCLHATV
jgi:hypothetical protein